MNENPDIIEDKQVAEEITECNKSSRISKKRHKKSKKKKKENSLSSHGEKTNEKEERLHMRSPESSFRSKHKHRDREYSRHEERSHRKPSESRHHRDLSSTSE
ncbi:hypothetical protein Ciccas_004354 [Cichlidogyrus casuarinus]|uniref:Uncharacterized protein n=1 Tax=Cichlidogyrus casuarinus TaxID=1844966 RepID=A0ABD2QBT4_9PLAT